MYGVNDLHVFFPSIHAGLLDVARRAYSEIVEDIGGMSLQVCD